MNEKHRDSSVTSAWALKCQEIECDSCELRKIVYLRIVRLAQRMDRESEKSGLGESAGDQWTP